jgi:outer membrane lipoprotein carrier protein
VTYIVFILLAAVPAFAAEPTHHGLLKRVEGRYNGAQTLEVQFTETYSGPGRGARTETGTLYLRKPGRMRLEYTSPPGKLFVSDGKTAFLYVPSSNEVRKIKLKETEDMRAPLAFLLGKLNFDKEFHNIEVRPESGGTLITAEPNSNNLPYSRVEFLVSATFEIRKLHIVNQDQSILDFGFDQEKLNPPLANGLFQFQPPAGAEVVEGGGGQ